MAEPVKTKDHSEESALKWRLAVAAAAHPVQVALVLALLLATIPVVMLLQAASDLRSTDRQLGRAIQATRTAREKIKTEGDIRSHQVCTLFVSSHDADVRAENLSKRQLRQTIEYLAKQPRPLTGINKAVEENLPQLKKDIVTAHSQVKANRPPQFCAELEATKGGP